MADALQVSFLIAGLVDTDGLPLVSGTVGFFETDGVTPKTIWEDADKLVVSANPVTLDARGTAQVWADGLYSIEIKDSSGSVIETIESLLFDPSTVTSELGIDASLFGSGDDADAISQAIASAVGSDKTIFLIDQDWDIDANLTIPANINLLYIYGAFTTVQGGFTLTFDGTIQAPLYNILRGAGTVVIDDKNNDIPSIWLQGGVHDNRTLDGIVTVPDTLNVNSNTLFVSAFKAGLGTNAPDFLLDIAGDARIEGANFLRFGGTGPADSDVSLQRSAVATLKLVGTFDLNSNNIINGGNIAGTLTTAAQPNVTSVGTLTGLTMGGDINLATNNIINGGNIAGTLTTASQPNITSVGTLTSLTMGGNINLGTNDITNGGTITATTLAGTLSTAAQPNITSIGTLTSLTMGGNINLGTNDITNGGTITATTLAGTLSTAAQPNITSVGTLTGLTMSGDINLATNDILNGGNIAGTLTTAAQPNITSFGTLTSLDVDNLNLNGNIISSTDTNGDIDLLPDGQGRTTIYGINSINFGDGAAGAFTSVGNFSLDGDNHYTNFTINSGHTLTIDTLGWVIIRCQGTFTLEGNIDGSGAGASGGTTIANDIGDDGRGGGGTAGGAGNATSDGGDGGDVKILAINDRLGGAGATSGGGTGGAGNSPSSQEQKYYITMFIPGVGAGGGKGNQASEGDGGDGGAGLMIIANDIVVIGSPTINLNGANGLNATIAFASAGGGGGGGVGLIYYRTNSSGTIPTPTIAAGLGGTSSGSASGDGGAGGAGFTAEAQI